MQIVLFADKADDYNYCKFSPDQIWLGNDTIVCTGSNYVLSPGDNYLTYYWQDGSGGPSINITHDGDYWVEVMDQHGCYTRDTVHISLKGTAANLGSDTSFCQDESITLSPGPGFLSYLWQDGSTSSSIVARDAGLYWVEIESQDLCKARDTIIIDIRPKPPVYLGSDTSLSPGQILNLDAGGGMDNYYWQDGSGEQSFTVSEPGVYWVQVQRDNCLSSDTILVTYDDCEAQLWVPNVFTPNGDGFNDTFKPVSRNLSSFRMLIFNRWGQLLYETHDPEASWDGRTNGKACAISTYFYLINYSTYCSMGLDKEGTLKGSVTLLE